MTNTIDWTKPIEAVHEDGRVEKMTFLVRNGVDWITRESPRGGQSNVYWHEDGSDSCTRSGWRIRNVTSPEVSDTSGQLPAALVERMVALVRRMGAVPIDTPAGPQGAADLAEARAIVAELPKPVDVDLIEARRLAQEWSDATTTSLALEAIRLGRQLEREAR